jgi:hypothetical protein
MKLMLRLTFCVLSLFFFSCIEEGSSEDKEGSSEDKSVPEVNPKGKKFLVKAKQYSREDFLAHKSADKAASVPEVNPKGKKFLVKAK